MGDEKNKEETTEEKGDKETPSKSGNILEDSRAERKLMDEQLERRERLIEREEAIAAANTLGGKSEAGQEPVKKKEITNKEYTRYIEEHGRAPDETNKES